VKGFAASAGSCLVRVVTIVGDGPMSLYVAGSLDPDTSVR